MAELLAGLSIGLAAGLSPGPLQAMVFTASIQRGFSAGWRVAVAPLITDAPIIALALLAVGALPDGALRVMGIAGGVAVMAFGVREAMSARRWAPADDSPGSADLWRGVVANALSPNAWLFWFIVGAPIIVEAWNDAPGSAIAFVGGFFGTLVGAKIALAAVVAAGRHRLSDRLRRRLAMVGAALLIIGGTVLLWSWVL